MASMPARRQAGVSQGSAAMAGRRAGGWTGGWGVLGWGEGGGGGGGWGTVPASMLVGRATLVAEGAPCRLGDMPAGWGTRPPADAAAGLMRTLSDGAAVTQQAQHGRLLGIHVQPGQLLH